jgi:MacB-like periplasmic core domain
VQPVLGRTFRTEQDQPGHPLVILSYGLWQRKYAGSRDVIGRTLDLDRIPYTIIGVMPRDFTFPLLGTPRNNRPVALWVPMAFTPYELQNPYGFYDSSVIARLRSGVTLAKAQSEAEMLARRACTQRVGFGDDCPKPHCAEPHSISCSKLSPVVRNLGAIIQ